jgi:Domain of unknown function (DUF5134)
MLTPAWLNDSLALMMLAVAAYCAGRVVVARLAGRATHYSFDAVHTAMGVAMAGMLTSRLATTLWVIGFAIAAAWFGSRAVAAFGLPTAISAGAYLRHLIVTGAMMFMLAVTPSAAFASVPAGDAMPGMTMTHTGGARGPIFAIVLSAALVGYTVMLVARIFRAAPQTPDETTILAPRTVACCQAAMNLTMGYMLVALL